MKVITRIAPSPTGVLHVGTARSALFNYLFAKHHGGTFIVRVEDTDKERSKKEFEHDILNGLHALGLQEDELYRQSERGEIYAAFIQKLIENDTAYISKEPSKTDAAKEVEVVRLRNPGKKITFVDEVRGEISFDTAELGDFVIARSTTEPLYHLAVVIDDETMGITHVIRGEDHISNTPRQILIQEAFGFERPTYAHMPLILAPDRSKLSKRHGAVAVAEYLENYTSAALINYLALLGWNPGTEQEIFSLGELIEVFDITKMQKSGAIFSVEKLDSINYHYLSHMPQDQYRQLVTKLFPKHITKGEQYTQMREQAILATIQERAKNMAEIKAIFASGDLDFFVQAPKITDASKLVWKEDSLQEARDHLLTLESILELIDATSFTAEHIKGAVWEYATEKGKGSVLWPFRFALSGKDKSPDPFSIAEALGKEETIARVQSATTLLDKTKES